MTFSSYTTLFRSSRSLKRLINTFLLHKLWSKLSTILTPKVNSTWHTRRSNLGTSSQLKYRSFHNPPFGSNAGRPIGIWWDIMQKKLNKGKLKRESQWVVIRTPMKLSIQEIRKNLKVCREKFKYYKCFGRRYRKQHLNKWVNQSKKHHN